MKTEADAQMARIEADREDLFAELQAWQSRWELTIPAEEMTITAAIRSDGRMAVYFGGDPCFHFNAENRLLRAFAEGELYRTQGITLARMKRERTAEQTELLRSDLNEPELAEFRERSIRRIQRLLSALETGDFVVLREVEAEVGALTGFQDRLRHVVDSGLPLAPAYPTRRV
ncbi:hypothetical protein SH661x_003750 [Planctomicrobium sp. SH661]|uniref:hypothetical protein n=1 Tax=Planctomicrobium sp. SH661 TaxID=3448124 RepID=UPI003F5B89F4